MMKAFWRMWPRRVRRPATSRGAADWRATLKQRAAIGVGALMLWTVAIEARLIYLQGVQRSELVERAERQQMRTRPLSPKRGDILDRRGHILATSVEADTIYAVPSAIADERDAVEKLCKALATCKPAERQELLERL